MIIPKPKRYEERGEIRICPTVTADTELGFGLKAFKRIFGKIYGVSLTEGEGGIEVRYDASLSEEEYTVDGAVIWASSLLGAKNGLATILQLTLSADKDGITLTDAKIKDKPDVEFRAFFADLARGWHDFDVLLGYVDICYINKIRYFQIHFTDDQSWTLPYRAFPNAATEGRSYTHEEIAYLVEYANEAGVEIIPEFEGIGHSYELIKKYPEEFGEEYDSPVQYENVMCIGNPNTLDNVRKMLGEVREVFKHSRYIHVGCDEASHENWSHCVRCRDYMKRQGIETTLELYAHFVKNIVEICISLGRTPIVWEGFGKEFNHMIPKEAIVMSWENTYQTTTELLEGGFKIVNAAWRPLYYVPEKTRQWNILDEDFYLYHWDTIAKRSPIYGGGATIEPDDRVLGAMMCQWESGYAEEHNRVVENLPPFSDRCWNVEEHYTKEEFPDREKLTGMQNKVY